MTDNTTSAADKLGANKGTNAIPQEVRNTQPLLVQSSDVLLSYL